MCDEGWNGALCDVAVTTCGANESAWLAGGLWAEYYADVAMTALATARVDATVNFAWGWNAPVAGVPSGAYAVRWRGAVRSPWTGWQQLLVNVNGGSVQLWLDQRQLALATGSVWVWVYMRAGQRHDLRLEFVKTDYAVVSLSLRGPNAYRVSGAVRAGACGCGEQRGCGLACLRRSFWRRPSCFTSQRSARARWTPIRACSAAGTASACAAPACVRARVTVLRAGCTGAAATSAWAATSAMLAVRARRAMAGAVAGRRLPARAVA